MTTTLRDLLPAKVRLWVYAALGVIVPTTTTLIAVLADGWQWTDLPLILASLVVSGGFGLAASNTPTSRTGDDRGAVTVAEIFYVLAIVALAIWIYRAL